MTVAAQWASQENLPIQFLNADLKQSVPIPASSLEGIICLESIIHFSAEERRNIFKDWYRMLKPGAKLLLTDLCILSGVISNDELAKRSLFGGYFFLPFPIQAELLEASGFIVTQSEDITLNNAAFITKKWYLAREKQKTQLTLTETAEEFHQIQLFLESCSKLYQDKKRMQCT